MQDTAVVSINYDWSLVLSKMQARNYSLKLHFEASYKSQTHLSFNHKGYPVRVQKSIKKWYNLAANNATGTAAIKYIE